MLFSRRYPIMPAGMPPARLTASGKMTDLVAESAMAAADDRIAGEIVAEFDASDFGPAT